MNTKLQTKRQVTFLAALFSLVYMVSYITRINYSAIIVEMERATRISKSLLSVALTGSAITYGVGQIVSGLCGDRISPKRLVFCGILTSVAMNLLIPLCRGPVQMTAVWCVNGFAQAFMWPPLVKMMSVLLSEEDYKKAVVKISWGSSFGTIAVYLISPLIISTLGWKAVFLCSALIGIIMLAVWQKLAYEVDVKPQKQEAKKPAAGGIRQAMIFPLMPGIMLAIVLQGMLRDGVTTWLPSYISETYHLSSSIAILTSVALPLFSILCFQLASLLYRKLLTNPLLCAGALFGLGALSALGIVLLPGTNAAFSIVLSAMLTGCMHGVNLILICMIPPFFKKRGNVSTVSGMLNSCTYVGSALSTYGMAFLSEQWGWQFTLLSWLLISVAGTLLCMLCVRPWTHWATEETDS